MTEPARTKGVYIGAPACFALEEAIRPVCEAFGAYQGVGGCYVVGSALERQNWRDVDVRLMLDDTAFAAEFPDAVDGHWESDTRWLLLTVAISEYLSKRTGLPIDFQFQPQTHANARHKGRRNAIGFRLQAARSSPADDPAKETDADVPQCTCLSISRDPLCYHHGDADKVRKLYPASSSGSQETGKD